MDRIGRLRRRGEPGLTALLRARPDVLVGRAPRTLAELADRLDSYPSVTAATARLDAPKLQVAVAVAGLGGSVSLYRLAELLDGDPRPQLTKLAELDLVEVDGDEVRMAPEVRRAVPDLLGLGHPFAEIAAVVGHEVLQAAEQALGLRPGSTKARSVAALQEFYGDAERVRKHAVEQVPGPALADLVGYAARTEFDDEPDDDLDPRVWQREQLLEQLGVRTGLMIGDERAWSLEALMPSEVALALRGRGFRIRFDPEPPPVTWLPVSRTASDGAAALAALDSAATAVLDQVAAKPVTPLRAGGVGRRELQRLAKATKVETGTVLLLLELAAQAGLIVPLAQVQVTDTFRAWRDADPAQRVVALASAWWRFPGRPGDERHADGTARAALTGARCNGCRQARQAIVGVLGAAKGLASDDARELAGWRSPSAHLDEHTAAMHLHEAEVLGVVAQGAQTPFGAALAAGDDGALLQAAVAALPPATVHATFGSDLTVLVAGSPSAAVSALLDSCAVRESSGGAVTWRLSAASVRAALDAGRTVETLRTALRQINATGTLPASVETLLDDVDRVYGRAVVQAANAVVVSEDRALLVEMAHDRRLAKLGLQLVAPTVLVAAVPPHPLATALRAAGYMPAWSDPTAARVPDPPPQHTLRQIEAIHARSLPDPTELARRLLTAGVAPPAASATERSIRRLNRTLSGDEVAVLAHAVDTHGRVQIVYESATGGITERVIRPTDVLGDRIWAWCELRSDEREFVLERVLGVRGV